MATHYDEFQAQPGDDAEDVVFKSHYGLRTIELNRPRALNALNGSMIRKIAPRMMEWEKSDMANVIVMKGLGGKAFCAGGDVKALVEANKTGGEAGRARSAAYFGLEYKLDHYIATYQKPYLAFMDGITMGGGGGLSMHAPIRIATENTVFAMPETKIGFFPDVGASFFLSRLNGALGQYLALTSQSLKGTNVFYAGIATHFCHSTSLPDLESRLAELRFRDYDSLRTRLSLISETIEEYATGLSPAEEPFPFGAVRAAIDRCFNKVTVPEIIQALEAETGPTRAWAQETLAALHERSPTSLHVALRLVRLGGGWSIADAFRREHAVATKFMSHPDFNEGVTALLMEKRAPRWSPATLADVPPRTDLSEPFLRWDGNGSGSGSSERLALWNERSYDAYPYASLGLPAETEVRNYVATASVTPGDLVKTVCQSRQNRQGVKEVVEEIMARKVLVDDHGKTFWGE